MACQRNQAPTEMGKAETGRLNQSHVGRADARQIAAARSCSTAKDIKTSIARGTDPAVQILFYRGAARAEVLAGR